jgi:hypothetical protein
MLPLGPWNCDYCGGTIKMKDGWLEYLTDEDHRSYGLKIFHHMEIGEPLGYCCSYQPNGRRRVGLPISSCNLVHFISHDGLTELLKIQKYDKLDADEVSLMIRRLHIPGYEQARPFFETAVREGIIHPPSTPGFFCQEDIQAVWSHYRIQNLNTLQQEQSP